MIAIAGFGTYSLISPLSRRAEEALDFALETTPRQWIKGNLLVESAYIPVVVSALEACGIAVKTTAGSATYRASEPELRAAAMVDAISHAEEKAR